MIVVAAQLTMHLVVTVAADPVGISVRMVVFAQIDIDVVHIYIYWTRMPVTPVRWIVTPIVGRIPSVVAGTPEEREDGRSINVHRFDDVVRTVEVRVADNLYVGSAVVFLFHYDGSHILEDVAVEDSLNNYEVSFSFTGFDYSQVIHLSVLIHIQVVDAVVVVVESSFEFLQVAGVGKQIGNSPQIEVVTDVVTFGLNGNVTVSITVLVIIVVITVIVSVVLGVA